MLDDARQNSINVPEARASETNVFRYVSGYERETRGYACKTTYILGPKKEILKLQITTKLIEENTNLSTFGKAIDRFVDRIKGVEKTTEQTLTANIPDKVYLRALPLRNLDDVDTIKQEVKSGNILILRVSPLAKRSIEDIKHAVSELCRFTESVGGDIARLGEERVVITPSFIRIWREKATISEQGTPTAA